ncbi:terpenoid synthase [Haematococcus lacustris]
MARPASNNVRVALEYCVKQVKTYDYENYIWVSQLSKEQRPSILALRALNIETALVAEQVKSKEPALVQVRYQWWRDGISAAFKGSAPKHPVLLALQAVLPGIACLPPVTLRLLEAREADALDTQPPLAVDGLEQYAEGTASQLLYLQLAAVGVQSREADHAASHLGKAVGIATLLRGLPYHAARRRSYVPMDLAVKYGVSQEDVYAGSSSEGMRDVALSIASVAKQHLDEARAFAPKLPRTACAVMLSSVGCARYLSALEAVNFDVFHSGLQPRNTQAAPLLHVLQTKYHMLLGTF